MSIFIKFIACFFALSACGHVEIWEEGLHPQARLCGDSCQGGRELAIWYFKLDEIAEMRARDFKMHIIPQDDIQEIMHPNPFIGKQHTLYWGLCHTRYYRDIAGRTMANYYIYISEDLILSKDYYSIDWTVAHELGHCVAGIREHHPDPDNLMHGTVPFHFPSWYVGWQEYFNNK